MAKASHIRHPVSAARAARQLLGYHISAVREAREAKRRYRDDPRFRLDSVEHGLRPQLVPEREEKDLLVRICDAYQASMSLPVSEVYRPTKWWEGFRRTGLRQVVRALEIRDFDSLQSMYANLFRDPCSDGLVRKTALLDPALSRILKKALESTYLSEALLRLDTWRSLTNAKHDLKDLRGPGIGNPFGIVLDGVLIPTDAVHQHYCAQRIGGILGDAPAVVAEIGGGYGGMAYYLLRDSPQITYINFDLPESLALATYYLTKSFPEKRILLYGETPTTNLSLRDADVVLLPLAELSAAKLHPELLVSSHVMSDLEPVALSVYLSEVNRLAKRYFLFQSMYPSGNDILKKMLAACPGFGLKDEKRFTMFAHERRDNVHWELLYERLQ